MLVSADASTRVSRVHKLINLSPENMDKLTSVVIVMCPSFGILLAKADIKEIVLGGLLL